MSDYYDVNFNFIRSLYPLSKEAYDKLYDTAELKEFKAGTKLVGLGEVSKKLYLINKGVFTFLFNYGKR